MAVIEMVKVSDEIGEGTQHPELGIVAVKQGKVCINCKAGISARAVVPAYQVVNPNVLSREHGISRHTATWLVTQGAVCWNCWHKLGK